MRARSARRSRRCDAGHDISVEVNLNAGVPVQDIRSTSHEIEQVNFLPPRRRSTLKGEKTIPNKDFVLRYDVPGKRIEDAVLAHRDERGGFFTLVLQPPDKIATEDRTPKEIVFVLDTSGSMSGFPIEKAKEAMKLSLDGLYPEDTFNLDHIRRRHACAVRRPGPGDAGESRESTSFPGISRGRRRNRDDEGDQGGPRSLGFERTPSHRLLYDRRLCRQR